MESNRVIGFALLIGGAMLALLGFGWGLASNLGAAAFILLLAILLPAVVMLVGAGAYILRRTSGEMQEMVEVRRQKKILSVLKTKGELSVGEAALEVNATADQVRQDVYDLVGKGLFSGYIDWDKGTLYSREARDLRASGTCPNCGGAVKLAGKGVVTCPYCGTEIFL